MDTKALVILPLPREDGKRLVELLDKNSLDVQAAFWGYQPEADEWQLYISTPLVASEGPLKVYQRLRELLEQQQPPLDITPNDISLISPSSTLVREIRKALRVLPGDSPQRLRRDQVEGIEEAYV